jgi:fructosamine-3-kinase
VPLHQLAPLVVHAIKFGGGYVAATQRALDAIHSLL